MSKNPVFLHVRLHVLARDGYTCQYCGCRLFRISDQTVDHILPRSLGGSNWGENLRAACACCNGLKRDSSAEFLRQHIAFHRTPFARFITLEQYHQLRGAGAALPELELRPFHFETKGA